MKELPTNCKIQNTKTKEIKPAFWSDQDDNIYNLDESPVGSEWLIYITPEQELRMMIILRLIACSGIVGIIFSLLNHY